MIQLDGTYKRMLELEETGNNTDNDIRSFLQMSYFIMQKIHMTNIFSDKDPCGLGDLVYDMQIFSPPSTLILLKPFLDPFVSPQPF